jgi:hypothetical protein
MCRLIVIGVILIGFPIIAHTQPNKSTEQQLISYERQSWEAVKQKDYEKFGRMLADDFSDIFSNGQVVTKPELLQTYIRGVELLDYSLSKFRVVMLNNNAAIVVYEALARGSESQATAHDIKKGEVTAIHVAVTSGWAKRKGKWLNVFYRENDIK